MVHITTRSWALATVLGLGACAAVQAEAPKNPAKSQFVWTEPAPVRLTFDDSDVDSIPSATAEDGPAEYRARRVVDGDAVTDEAPTGRSIRQTAIPERVSAGRSIPGRVIPERGISERAIPTDDDDTRFDDHGIVNDRRFGHAQLIGARHSEPVFSAEPVLPPETVYEDSNAAGPPPVCAVDCPAFWEHRSSVWGEYLFLRPRGTDLVYASTVDGTLATSVPLGDRSVSAFGYASGFRVGLGWAVNQCSSITANYTWYENNTIDSVGLPGGGGSFLAAETVHPNTQNVAADSLAATALYDLQLQSADLNFKGLLYGSEDSALNYVVGVKYARMEEDFQGNYAILGTTIVNTNVNFDGMGPRFGFEGEHRVGCGFLGYTKGTVNFLVGTSSADFTQTNVFTGVQARSGLQDSRILTVPELEVGGGWQNYNGCVRVTAGYFISAWFNMLTTPEYLSTIRVTQNSYQHDIRTLTLDGLSARIEFRY